MDCTHGINARLINLFLPSIALGGQALGLKGLGGENGQCERCSRNLDFSAT